MISMNWHKVTERAAGEEMTCAEAREYMNKFPDKVCDYAFAAHNAETFEAQLLEAMTEAIDGLCECESEKFNRGIL